MAAQPLVKLSYQQPILTYNTNIMGTVNILEAARNLDSIKAILVVTSDSVITILTLENPLMNQICLKVMTHIVVQKHWSIYLGLL